MEDRKKNQSERENRLNQYEKGVCITTTDEKQFYLSRLEVRSSKVLEVALESPDAQEDTKDWDEKKLLEYPYLIIEIPLALTSGQFFDIYNYFKASSSTNVEEKISQQILQIFDVDRFITFFASANYLQIQPIIDYCLKYLKKLISSNNLLNIGDALQLPAEKKSIITHSSKNVILTSNLSNGLSTNVCKNALITYLTQSSKVSTHLNLVIFRNGIYFSSNAHYSSKQMTMLAANCFFLKIEEIKQSLKELPILYFREVKTASTNTSIGSGSSFEDTLQSVPEQQSSHQISSFLYTCGEWKYCFGCITPKNTSNDIKTIHDFGNQLKIISDPYKFEETPELFILDEKQQIQFEQELEKFHEEQLQEYTKCGYTNVEREALIASNVYQDDRRNEILQDFNNHFRVPTLNRDIAYVQFEKYKVPTTSQLFSQIPKLLQKFAITRRQQVIATSLLEYPQFPQDYIPQILHDLPPRISDYQCVPIAIIPNFYQPKRFKEFGIPIILEDYVELRSQQQPSKTDVVVMLYNAREIKEEKEPTIGICFKTIPPYQCWKLKLRENQTDLLLEDWIPKELIKISGSAIMGFAGREYQDIRHVWSLNNLDAKSDSLFPSFTFDFEVGDDANVFGWTSEYLGFSGPDDGQIKIYSMIDGELILELFGAEDFYSYFRDISTKQKDNKEKKKDDENEVNEKEEDEDEDENEEGLTYDARFITDNYLRVIKKRDDIEEGYADYNLDTKEIIQTDIPFETTNKYEYISDEQSSMELINTMIIPSKYYHYVEHKTYWYLAHFKNYYNVNRPGLEYSFIDIYDSSHITSLYYLEYDLSHFHEIKLIDTQTQKQYTVDFKGVNISNGYFMFFRRSFLYFTKAIDEKKQPANVYRFSLDCPSGLQKLDCTGTFAIEVPSSKKLVVFHGYSGLIEIWK